GGSFGIGADRGLAFQLPRFEECVALTGWRRDGDGWRVEDGAPVATLPETHEEADYRACMLGLRDYVNKNGFRSVVLGYSGGIDSALCAALAVDALGSERVHLVMLPYEYTSEESLRDASDGAKRLGCRYDVVPIAEPVQGCMAALAGLFAGTETGVTEENLQSRIRGTLLMAVSNKFGPMVVTT